MSNQEIIKELCDGIVRQSVAKQAANLIESQQREIGELRKDKERLEAHLFKAVSTLEKLENGDFIGTPINQKTAAMTLIKEALKTLPVCMYPVDSRKEQPK